MTSLLCAMRRSTALYGRVNLNAVSHVTPTRIGLRWISSSRTVLDIGEVHLKYREKIKQKLEAHGAAEIPKLDPEQEMRKFFKVDGDALDVEYEEVRKKIEAEMEAQAEKEKSEHEPLEGDDAIVNALPLDRILDIPKISTLKASHIGALWLARYETDDSRCGVGLVRDRTGNHQVYARGKVAPMFVLPLPHENGSYEMFLSEFRNSQCFITSILEYQTRGQDSRPAMTITSYTHFAKEKDLVLVLGEYNKDMINKKAADILLQQLEVLYNQSTDEQFMIVRQFNTDPKNFDLQSIIPKPSATSPASEA
eukprot:CFRG4147T1